MMMPGQQVRTPPSPGLNNAISGLNSLEMDLRRQNDQLNQRIGQVMDNGAYKMPANGNDLSAQIKNMIAEVDGNDPTGGALVQTGPPPPRKQQPT